MHVAYWIVAALLALFYGFAGGKKLLESQERLRPMMGWVDQIPMPCVRVLGALEILGALGLLLPPLTGIAVVLAVAAAVGLALVQIGGMALHLSRGEAQVIVINVVFLALSAVAAWLATAWL
ncbi:DoxX family protein [Streptomyces sp. NPDC056161]|uniref:DoxX family protein n=1 Tax=Streptomyces sp. NPDC056161 TaxID=3345732 RepID=UPI0035DC5104